jgi:hypothetical protein
MSTRRVPRRCAVAVICRSSAPPIHACMTRHIVVGLTLASRCAMATNAASLVKHRGAKAAPDSKVARPLHGSRLRLRSRWFAIGLALAMFAGELHIAALPLAPMSIVQAVLAAGAVLLAGLAERLLGGSVRSRPTVGLITGATLVVSRCSRRSPACFSSSASVDVSRSRIAGCCSAAAT